MNSTLFVLITILCTVKSSPTQHRDLKEPIHVIVRNWYEVAEYSKLRWNMPIDTAKTKSNQAEITLDLWIWNEWILHKKSIRTNFYSNFYFRSAKNTVEFRVMGFKWLCNIVIWNSSITRLTSIWFSIHSIFIIATQSSILETSYKLKELFLTQIREPYTTD